MSKLIKSAAGEIRGIPYERKRLESLRRELEEINTGLYSPRGTSISEAPAHGSGNQHENKIVSIIGDPKREHLIRLIAEQEKKLELIESILALLSPLERRILEALCGEHPAGIASIMAETNYSDTQINRIKYAALSKYAYMRGLDAKCEKTVKS